jgi:hypothetical protein
LFRRHDHGRMVVGLTITCVKKKKRNGNEVYYSMHALVKKKMKIPNRLSEAVNQ